MHIGRLGIANTRRISFAELSLDDGMSLIVGPNGSGKTSLLEGAAIACSGKSFHTNAAADLIHRGAQGLGIRAMMIRDQGEHFHVAISKTLKSTDISIDQRDVNASSEIAKHCPLVVLHAQSYQLVSSVPAVRRNLLDRTMFHVEHSYLAWWRGFHQALRARNALLRENRPYSEAIYWDEQLLDYAAQINTARFRFIDFLSQYLKTAPLSETYGKIAVKFRQGWREDDNLATRLKDSWREDCARGHTRVGPHRADITFESDEHGGKTKLSRGQAKVAAVAVKCAQAAFIIENTDERPVFLVDDLASELDSGNISKTLQLIATLGCQTVLTAIRSDSLSVANNGIRQMFHVEHGDVVSH
ncbi:MAG: DNA replication and repair protein RecF [Pseudomonadota bacterium]